MNQCLQVLTLFLFAAGMMLAPGTVGARHASETHTGEMHVMQDRVVQGTVTAEDDGTALPGVNIIIKGTSNGVITDAQGKFSISADQNDVLVFSYVGYESQEVTVGTQSTVNITLKPDLRSLEEVVIIGYGEKSRKLMTESIGTVDSEAINKVPVASADQALQGRVSGVQVTAVDGTPGAPVAIRIRGVGTVGNTQPLFVIDGVPVGNNTGGNPNGPTVNPLSTINPADIESISVLKDASASAVYGVRAANGVVLITTKRGTSGKPTVTFDGYYGVQNIRELLDYNDTDEWLSLTQDAYNNFNAQNGLLPGDPSYRELHPDIQEGSPIRDRNNRQAWLDEALNKNAPIQNYNLGISGGNENARYYVSGGYFNQEATIQKYELERYSFRVNADFKISDRIEIGQTFTVSYQEIFSGVNGGGDGFLLRNTSTMPPFFNIFEDPNNPIPGNRYGYDGNADLAGLTIGNQVGINRIVDSRDRNTRLLGSVYGRIKIIEGLHFKTSVSLDYLSNRDTGWRPEYLVAEMGLNRPGNESGDSRGESVTQVYTNTLNFNRNFGDHGIDVLAGIEYQENNSTNLGVTGYNFLSTDPDFYAVVGNGRDDPRVGGGAGNNSFVGYIGRVSYNYADKYLFTGTVRRDGTSAFSPEDDRRWGTFPSFSAAWRISEEAFFPQGDFISDLKIRGSWGQLGNSNTTSYPHIFRVSTTPDYGSGNTTIQAPAPINFVNEDVIWETVETTDVGFDVSMFDNKFDLLVTYYNRTTKDFLYNLPIPAISGFGSTPVNLGEVSNKGVEIELGYNHTFTNGFQLSLSGNFSTVKNRLESLAPGIEEFVQNGVYRTAVGQPIGYFFGYRTDGLWQTQGDIDAVFTGDFVDASSPQGPRPGDVRFLDINGQGSDGAQFSGEPDGRIDFYDRTYLGKTIPTYFYGFNIGMNYKNFDLSIFFQGVGDVQVYNAVRASDLNLGGGGRNMLVESQGRWTGPGTSNSVPRAISGDPNDNDRFSDRFVEDAGFLRLRNVQLGYNLPTSVLSSVPGFRSARVYIAASNLFVITDYSGMDPEVLTYRSGVSSQIGAGTDGGNMPQPRTVQLGVQLQF